MTPEQRQKAAKGYIKIAGKDYEAIQRACEAEKKPQTYKWAAFWYEAKKSLYTALITAALVGLVWFFVILLDAIIKAI